MKKIFTLFTGSLFALFLNTVKAQVTQDFEGTLPSCFVVSSNNVSSSSDGGSNNSKSLKVSFPANLTQIPVEFIATPYIDIPANATVSAYYNVVSSNNFNGTKNSKIEIGILDKSNNFKVLNTVTVDNNTAKSGPINGTVPVDAAGTYRIQVRITESVNVLTTYIDNITASSPSKYHYTVNGPCNQAPTANNDVFTATKVTAPFSNNVITNTVGGSDRDPNNSGAVSPDVLKVVNPSSVVLDNPSQGTLSMDAAGNFTFTPSANFTGGDVTFKYQVTDNGYDPLSSNTATVTLHYPKAPTAVNDNYSSKTIISVTGNVITNASGADIEPNAGQTLTATLVSGPSVGTLSFNSNGSFTYAPPTSGFAGGNITFTYKVTDASYSPLSSNTATVTITYPAPPVANDDKFTKVDLTTITGNVITNPTNNENGVPGTDTDPNGLPLTAILVAGPSEGKLALSADGSFSYTPATGFTGGPVTFTYRVTDNNYYFSNIATVSLNYPIPAPVILPVKLVSFQGTASKEHIQLQWSVAENETADRFEVEKSTDGKNFTTTAIAMSSNKSGYEVYQLNEAPAATKIMYRLKMFDKAGVVNYSKILSFQSATTTAATNFKVNTATSDKVTATITANVAEDMQLNIYDLSGKLLQQQKMHINNGQNMISVSLNSNFKTGIYVAEMSSNTQHQSTKFFIQ